MAPVVRKLKGAPEVQCLVAVTAQHREMLDQVLKVFDIQADFDLNVMKPNQSLPELTGRLITGVSEVIEQSQPDWILVHGDTTTTLAASLAAFYAKVPVAHVEAGLRTGDLTAPWPEELNRRFTGLVTSLHFAPTEIAKKHLLAEGVKPEQIVVTGNTVIDALFEAVAWVEQNADVASELQQKFHFLDTQKKMVLVTGHRRENFGEGFLNICMALKEIADHPEVEVVYPVHLNPNVQKPVNEILQNHPRVHLIPPQDYLPFVYLMKNSHIILTDSGGVQEEAPSLGKPVLVMREVTERPEAVKAGVVELVGTNREKIVSCCLKLLSNEEAYQRMSQASNPYGDGRASERILSQLLKQGIEKGEFNCAE